MDGKVASPLFVYFFTFGKDQERLGKVSALWVEVVGDTVRPATEVKLVDHVQIRFVLELVCDFDGLPQQQTLGVQPVVLRVDDDRFPFPRCPCIPVGGNVLWLCRDRIVL